MRLGADTGRSIMQQPSRPRPDPTRQAHHPVTQCGEADAPFDDKAVPLAAGCCVRLFRLLRLPAPAAGAGSGEAAMLLPRAVDAPSERRRSARV